MHHGYFCRYHHLGVVCKVMSIKMRRPSVITNSSKGFSIVELSLVLLIIGLIAGAILGGKELIRAGEIRGTIAFITDIQKAYIIFEDKYKGLPGDIANASTLFSGATNGSGNGNYGVTSFTTNAENYLAWNHLGLANLIQGAYTGTEGSGPVRGINVPKVPVNDGTAAVTHWGTLWNTYNAMNSILLTGVAGYPTPTIPVLVAHDIDQKIDDKNPFRGGVIGYSDTAGECSSVNLSSAPSAAIRNSTTYNTGSAADLCVMHFGIGETTWY